MYVIWGKVVHGKKRGKRLGFPTANIRLHKSIPEGIYISQTKTKKVFHSSVTFVGSAKTFNETAVLVETYLLAGQFMLYDKWISIKLLKKIRDNKKFADASALKIQMERDILAAKEYFKKAKYV